LVQARAKTIRAYVDFVASALTEDEIRQFEAILGKLVARFKL
jgi:hypothetical protein